MNIILVILAILIIVVVGLQSKGNGLSIIPGSGDFGKFERRGAEKMLHLATIIFVTVFIVLALVSYFIS
jgi:protein translocase SecG subunit